MVRFSHSINKMRISLTPDSISIQNAKVTHKLNSLSIHDSVSSKDFLAMLLMVKSEWEGLRL